MDSKIIETCFNCKNHQFRLKRIKKENFCELYLDICKECPYKTEFLVLSGNENSELPMNKMNVDDVVSWMNKSNAYHVERTSKYINIFFDKNYKITHLEKTREMFSFLRSLNWSDNLKKYANFLKKELSIKFLNNLTSKKFKI
jgi:hypothetical protein